MCIRDRDWTGRVINGIPVVANEENAAMYVCQEWIDEVLIVISEVLPLIVSTAIVWLKHN